MKLAKPDKGAVHARATARWALQLMRGRYVATPRNDKRVVRPPASSPPTAFPLPSAPWRPAAGLPEDLVNRHRHRLRRHGPALRALHHANTGLPLAGRSRSLAPAGTGLRSAVARAPDRSGRLVPRPSGLPEAEPRARRAAPSSERWFPALNRGAAPRARARTDSPSGGRRVLDASFPGRPGSVRDPRGGRPGARLPHNTHLELTGAEARRSRAGYSTAGSRGCAARPGSSNAAVRPRP
jgi:hypothetical protein